MLYQINRRRGFSLIELLIVISIILIIITVAVPKFQKAQMGARELGAIKAIQTIHQAQVQYQSQFSRYATSLQELGPPASGPATPSAADLIGNRTEAEAYLRVTGERYRLMRTHEWNDEIISRLRDELRR